MLLAFLFTSEAWGVHVVSPQAHIDIRTEKVTHIQGWMEDSAIPSFVAEQLAFLNYPGDRVVVINSGGGIIDTGYQMLANIWAEQGLGAKVICVVTKHASSMAFNLLGYCDVKLATKNSQFLVHKVECQFYVGQRQTAKAHRELAAIAEKVDEPFRQRNSRLMHLTLPKYDKYADDETVWTAEQLLNMHYLDGLATVTDDN